MLEDEEVDIDFFTPIASTSLARIFSNDTKFEDKNNTSLKYVPKPALNLLQKQEESKATQIVYACALYGYEWDNNAYVSRGKLGAAILKKLKTEQYNILLYDSNKVTMSCTNVSPQLQLVTKGSTNFSYYDNQQKYWSIYGTEVEISRFIDKLKSLKVQINMSSNTEKGPNDTHIKKCETMVTASQILRDEKESDTDSSINRRTKDSILKRMATMGHSVLPLQAPNLTKACDSSDSDEGTQRVIRHKPPKKIFSEKNDHTDSCIEIDVKKNTPKLKHSDSIPMRTYDQQLVPIKSTNIITNPIINNSNELNLFMSEQRISNSELRINMNRMTDKVDKILEKVQGIGDSANNSGAIDYQNNIVQKLLSEYEKKIKNYESFLISKGLDFNSVLKLSQEQEEDLQKNLNELNLNKSKIQALQNIIEEQERENCKLKDELKCLQEKYNIICKEKEVKHHDQTTEVNRLKEELSKKNEELTTLSKILENNSLPNNSDVKDKLKSIMNKTFHSLSANFDDGESYEGPIIKTLVANIIKKETMEAIKEV